MTEEKKLVPKRRLDSYSEAWVEKELNDLGTFGRTYSFSRSKEGRGIYHHIHYGDIHTKNLGVINNNSILPTIKEEGTFELLKQGDIVIADASEDYKDLGKTTVIGETENRKIIAGLHTFKFTPNEFLYPIYYLYYSQSRIFKNFTYKTGTGISVFGISKDNLGKMRLYIPTYEEQKKIGEFFKVLDERIANQERKIAKVKALKSAYLTEMFPQEGETVPKRRFKDFNEEWSKRRLKELGEILTGSTPPTNILKYYSDSGVPWVTPTDIKENITLVTAKHLSEEGQKVARLVPKNTILVTSIASIGKNTILGTTGSFNQQINGLIPNQSENDPYFLYVASTLWSRILANKAASGTMQIVNKTEFSNLITFIPSLKEQQKIGQFFKNLDNKITTEEKKLEKLKKMKEAYLEEMFV